MSDEELSPGTLVVGRYQVVRLLGAGSVKRVFLAYDRLAQRQVALCLLRGEHGPDTHIGARFSREGRAAAALLSPYVVRVFDVGKTARGTRYLATEAVLGRGLDEALAYGALPARAAVLWAAQVLAALEEAHRVGVVHRDVKPENVMLAPSDGGVETAKLTDFGLARLADPSLEGSIHLRTVQGLAMGTPDYMPPEQWGGGEVDPRSDLYATGMMLHEMLLGYVAFHGESVREIASMHAAAPVPAFPDDVGDDVRAFEGIVRRALQKDPAARFGSAEAMRVELQRVGNFRLPAPPTVPLSAPEAVDEGALCAELTNDVGGAPVQLIAGPCAVLGRASTLVVRCVPHSDENEARTRTVSRRHARIDWRGGHAWVTDLHSASGTSVNGRRLGAEPRGVRLTHGDELGLGPHVRFVFEHAPATEGELPAWARLARADRYGAGVTHVFVLLDADIGADNTAAIPLGADVALGDRARIRLRGKRFVAVSADDEPVELRDGSTLRVGGATFAVAIDEGR